MQDNIDIVEAHKGNKESLSRLSIAMIIMFMITMSWTLLASWHCAFNKWDARIHYQSTVVSDLTTIYFTPALNKFYMVNQSIHESFLLIAKPGEEGLNKQLCQWRFVIQAVFAIVILLVVADRPSAEVPSL